MLNSEDPVNPKDPAEFSRRMEVLLKDEELRVLWRKWAKNYVKQYNYPRIVDRYLEIYKTARKQPRERTAVS
jgi:glycosyltransferase involved in cell wall biosynthesis